VEPSDDATVLDYSRDWETGVILKFGVEDPESGESNGNVGWKWASR
jgi:hypothetical protein